MKPAPTGTRFPPLIGPDDRVILFDGVCRLCSGTVQFILRHDKKRVFRLAAIQSPEGQALMHWFGFSPGMSATLILVEGNRVSTRSTAVLRIAGKLPNPWRLLALGWIVPRPIRDWMYDRVARNRYRWFGKRESCLVPSPKQAGRFLDGSTRV